ncbi:type V CRISPR-associated protein Cas12b [Brevibacillus sp. GCM10020057]|uniref:type V CRISPR-associated protein Cas12b n=1 Tax=Brevibacillus sp. GCM10020057 TaxID=3317327 RepID=UPI0036438AF7
MKMLLLFRQESTGEQSKEEIKEELIRHIREQQQRNQADTNTQALPLDKALQALRQLYELLVPSSVGQSGDAQIISRKFLSPLVDPKSEGGKGTSKAGAKPAWQKKKEANDPTWEQDYEKWKKRREEDPTATVIATLEEYGIKPLFSLYTNTVSKTTDVINDMYADRRDIEWLPLQSNQYVRTWDRDMLQQAIERLLSWESWNKRVQEEYAKLEEKMAQLNKQLEGGQEWISLLEQYEEKREQELIDNGTATNDKYRITKRQMKGWNELYEIWSTFPPNASHEQYKEALKRVQQRLRGRFGDAHFFQYLMKEEKRLIWKGNPQRIHYFVARNELTKRLKEAKQGAALTLPHTRRHPLWVRFDARGGNLQDYYLTVDSDKPRSKYFVTFSNLIWPSETGWMEKKDVEVELALSKQFYQQVTLRKNDKGKQEIEFKDKGSGSTFSGHLGGAKLQLERGDLEKEEKNFEDGEIGSVYLNVVIDFDPLHQVKNGRLQAPYGQVLKLVRRPNEFPKVVTYKSEELVEWMKASPQHSLGVDSLASGFRVMSIDLGLRTAAATSVFAVEESSDENAADFSYGLEGTPLVAVHQRSYMLRLPGEQIEKQVRERRDGRFQQHQRVKFQIRLLTQMMRLANKQRGDRWDELDILKQAVEQKKSPLDQTDRRFWERIVRDLTNASPRNEAEWEQAVVQMHRTAEEYVGKVVQAWRKRFAADERKGIAGLSMWNIEELEGLRKLLISWNRRTRKPQEVNRFERGHTSHKRLLNHIQNVKEDRLKQLSHAIVMTALGYVYDDQKQEWYAKYPACQIILFENLSQYRSNLDRSTKENSTLMKWAHRSIPKYVHMQAEPYGIQIGDVRAEYSSRFHAKTGTPGIRCKRLSGQDLQGSRFENLQKRLVNEQFLTEEQVRKLKPGDIVPDDSGELFMTLTDGRGGKEVVFLQADINAAQNLQKRFWQRYNELFKVSCRVIVRDEKEYLVPKTKSVQAKLGKGLFVKKSDTALGDVYVWDSQAKLKDKTTFIEESESPEQLEDFQEIIEEAEEAKGTYRTLFRDPSGVFFPEFVWHTQKEFWGGVKRKLYAKLRERLLAKVR